MQHGKLHVWRLVLKAAGKIAMWVSCRSAARLTVQPLFHSLVSWRSSYLSTEVTSVTKYLSLHNGSFGFTQVQKWIAATLD